MQPSATTLRVNEPAEILALVPHRLGFRPQESVVAVSLRPPRGLVGVVARVDLLQLADPHDGADRARALTTLLDRDGATRVLLVVYTDDDPRGAAEHPAHRAVELFREAAEAPFGDVVVWVVTSTGYLALDCRDDCCPSGGRPLRELDSTQVGAELVLAGSAVADSRADVATIRPASAERRRSVARVRRRWEARREEALQAGEEAAARWRLDSVAAWRAAVSHACAGPAPGGAPWGRLEAGLADRRVRDSVLVALVPGTGELPERCVRGAAPAPRDEAALASAVATILDPGCAAPPPVVATRVHEDVLEHVVAHGRAGQQAPALTLLALLAWWRGDGARAAVLLDRALGDDGRYRLALLLHGLVEAGVGPGWTRRGA
ncbi:hypothetical protein Cch01nite_12550 [Cellulomonas chitinilytica]|uniref:DUF4192 domain-containing protein n=1 Tax=Cellulomonas chitinilytica TaxID=398759 RepID=A0A919NZG8_9CELL|nr:DUF4192 domain-containing protein [Cellulomonas chitinilytica]GIG20531.1 hypothetical protein Cch01nite_12550 [Cellulomonas chitinilytica]